ncbi:MAG: glycosyltransferase family 4 protein [Gammaproteobacteria bacterium]|nr:glycosyltransferase family 4 protein [Gammaproteobacteria bacterium]
MRLAFCLFRYFPFGGLQRDFVRIAKTCLARGHGVEVYTMRWEGERFSDIPVTIIPPRGWQNHTRIQHFISDLQKILQHKSYDGIVGFNKMPGLTFYYAADGCLRDKLNHKASALHRWLPRYRTLLAHEYAVFSQNASTQILLIAANQQEKFMQHYHTSAERFHILPPGIQKSSLAPVDVQVIREKMRREYHVRENDFVLLFVGSGFRTKGLDRVLDTIAALPIVFRESIKLFVIGQDDSATYLDQAKSLDIQDQVQFLGGRNDVSQWMLTADLLIHPARFENTGTVLLEAIAAGLPVLTTDVCGYAHYVSDAEAGIVLPSPFDEKILCQTLQDMMRSPLLATWQKNALAFAKSADLYSMPEHAVDCIEALT